ncbi:MAG: NAD-dependent succinate-semialdehyde dehydrogenase [Gemmatimonadetes bacterium]|nr:NAD-dependent succinate-semialdehyde dehydrogenase [Gemmatimonadota bacterium]
MSLDAVNPATGTVIRKYPEMEDGAVEDILAHAHQAYLEWRDTDFPDRAAPMRAAATILRDRSRELAELMTREMGKPVAAGEGEVEKCAWVCEHYAEHAEAFLAPVRVETEATRSYWTHRPLGVVLAVMPWNFPFWQVFRFAAPGLMAGNAGVLKHASNVPGCALAIEEVFRDAGFPEHLFRTLMIGSPAVEKVIEDERVRAVTLTGSVGAGKAVASKAGSLVKKTVLELGGSDPYVVLEDADLAAAAETCASSRLINSGQSCIAAKRFVVVDAVHDAFLERFSARMKKAKMGDPLKEDTEIGPQATEALRDQLHDQVRRSVDAGARLVVGGEVPDKAGAWYPPTVLADVAPGMPAWEEELFGPVAAVIRADDEEDAIRIANATSFGLGAAVFTKDLERGERIARDRLEAGCCFVNALVKSDPRLPFGGIKESGYGRELSPLGIREFVNVKTVWVD